MFGKLKQAKEALQAQKKLNDLKKKLGKITVEVEEGNVRIKAKASISMMEVESVEVNGEEVGKFSDARKSAEKKIQKEIQKKVKKGELKDLGGMLG